MFAAKFKHVFPVFPWTIIVSAFAMLIGEFPIAAEENAPANQAIPKSKLDLTPQRFPALWSLVRPQESEWRHVKVEWLTDVVAARKRAAAEDKPLVICYTGGAGYNEPLGVC